MVQGTCQIWGSELLNEGMRNAEGSVFCVSPRAGGLYEYGWRLGPAIAQLNSKGKAKLTTWLVNQRRSGVSSPNISLDIIDKIESFKNYTTSKRIDGLLLYFLSKEVRPGYFIEMSYPEVDMMMAWSESIDLSDFKSLMNVMGEMGLVNDARKLTPQAFVRIEELETTNINSKQAFVAMWFDPSLNDSYEQAIEPAIREAGYEPRIIRKVEHNNKIDDEIIAEIRRSKFVIADFTCGFSKDKSEAIARGGVYYEAGFAQGLGLPVIWTCREDIISHVHFDTRQYNHIVWTDSADLNEKLLNRIRATIT